MKINQYPKLPTFKEASAKTSMSLQQKHRSILSCALMLSGLTFALPGCQSNAITRSAPNANKMLDFNIADISKNQAQSTAFNANLNSNAQRYEQIFDQRKYPNSDQQAKQHLLTAIRQHMASEHVAVAQANYNTVPYIDSESIDAGSSSLLRTLLEVYAYRENKDSDIETDENDDSSDASKYDDSYDSSDNENDYDIAEEVVVVEDNEEAESATFKVAYHKDGYDYDQEGYDEDGYDENGYDRSGYDNDGYDENGYDSNGYDYEGYNEEGVRAEGYDEYDNDETGSDETDSEEADTSFSAIIANNNPREIIADFEAMQAEKQAREQGAANADSDEGLFETPGALSLLLGMIHKTPEQIKASNAYQYQYLTLNSVSQYLPKQRQFKSVYSYDYAAPTMSSSVQLPVALDFNNSKLTVDPSAIMPIIALVNPENTALPNQSMSHTVDFGLPEAITSQFPSAVIYDAAINAMQDSMAELDPEHFSTIDIREDDFAKQVNADRAIKVYFGSKQSGEFIGKMFKYMSQSLEQYVDAHPEKYPDDTGVKTAIDKLQLYNKSYQSDDIGAFIQLIEAIAPISFNQVNYYYLDSSDRLLAKQQRVNVGSDLLGSQSTVLNRIRYDLASYNKNALTPLLEQSFGENAKPALDGNAWLATQRQQKERLEEARSARYSYEEDNNDDNDYHDSIEADEDTGCECTVDTESAQAVEFDNESEGKSID